MTLGARLTIIDTANVERIVEAEAFLDSRSPSTLQPDELVVDCWFPAQLPGNAWGFYEVQRRAAHYALVGVAVTYATDGDGSITEVRVAASGLARCPIRLRSVEASLSGQLPAKDVFAAAARSVTNDPLVQPIEDIHATADYRREVAPAVVERALLSSLS
jgi:carbon-monoxide dehydrogenase medium subunit